MASRLRIDGSYGEGGGQLVRTSLSLSTITGRSIVIERIRARRSKPGLRAQHLTAVRAAAELCAAKVEGAELDARSFCFEPSVPPRPGQYRWAIGTAGAVSLVFQTVLWPLAFASGPSQVTLVGGTHVAWSPPIDYLQQVYLPVLAGLAQAGERHTLAASAPVADLGIELWGWYPRGGGQITAHIAGGVRLQAWTQVERGSLRKVSVFSMASNLPAHIRRRQAERADFVIRKHGIKPRVEVLSPPSPGQGTAVFVLAEYRHARAGFTSYGRLRKPAEKVAEEACRAFFRYHKRGQPVDEHLADQLLLPLAFAAGSTRYAVESVSSHLLTQAWLIEQFLDDVRIEIDGQEGHPGIVSIIEVNEIDHV